MSVLGKRSLDSAQMKPLSREKDDCKSKTWKEWNIIIHVLTFIAHYEWSTGVVNTGTNKDVVWHTI